MDKKVDISTWTQEVSLGNSSPESLEALDLLDEATIERKEEIKENFDIRVPHEYIELIKQGNEQLKKQFVPDARELNFQESELMDPIGDENFTPVEYITHRYPDRVLLKVTYNCGVYCRYCFRRYKVSDGKQNPSEMALDKALNYIAEHPEIKEVILTGGDPLIISNSRIQKIIQFLNKVDHLQYVRFHTRMPTVVPSRVNDELIDILNQSRHPIWFVLHINHSNEITPRASEAIKKLVHAGIPLLCQSVLLKDINDNYETLKELCLTLVRNKISPYYLHYPDLAQGTNHFRIPLEKAIELVSKLRGQISGFAIPQLVVDIPEGLGKITFHKNYYEHIGDNKWIFTSPLTGKQITVDYPRS